MKRICLPAALLLVTVGLLLSSPAWAIIYLPYTAPTVIAKGAACYPAEYSAGPVYVGRGPSVWFHAEGEDKDQRCDTGEIVNDPLTYKWDFGDGSPVEWGEYTTHGYDQLGEYTVTCTAYDIYDPKYCDEGSVSDDIVVRVFEVDLDIDAVPDNQEEDPGGFVPLNNDDDDQDEVVDFEDPSVPGEDDLVPITIQVLGRPPPVGGVQINWTDDPSKKEDWGEIDIFESQDKSNPVTRSTTYAVGSLPKTLYVEGDNVSAALGDVSIWAHYVVTVPVCSMDTVKLTVLQLDLTQPADGAKLTGATAGVRQTREFYTDVELRLWPAAANAALTAITVYYKKGEWENSDTPTYQGESGGAAVYILEFDLRTRFTKADVDGISYRYRFRGTAYVGGLYLQTGQKPYICIKKGEEIWYTVATSNDWLHYPYHWGSKGPDRCSHSTAHGPPADGYYDHEPYVNDVKEIDGRYRCCFDCSGFAHHMYERCAISIPEGSAADQYNALPHMTVGSEVRGDLVFFGDPIEHVKVFGGDDMCAHAPKTGEWTCTTTLGSPSFAAGMSAEGWCMTSACSH